MTQATATRNFMSIGEVAEALAEEFPEVSISKIRFLEAEGLIEPERTPSGYRKFYTSDVARLRYILRLQRDQFMPLKVIRERLERFEPQEGPSIGVEEKQSAPDEDDPAQAPSPQLSFEDLVSASGLGAEDVRELEEYGLIDAHRVDGEAYYDEDDLLVARIARDLSKYGIEPRHMRMYRNFAERESGLFEQALLPLSRPGTPGGQILQSLTELTKLSRRLKQVLLKASLREHLGGSAG
jgi:DNA-binding transcriptional MerR regulator